jgi:type I pantothenate kinase
VTDAPALLAELARSRVRDDGAPVVVGIAGAVASGKSTLADAVAQRAIASGTHTDVVSTDGFLFSNETLVEKGLLARKGFPESYDVDALCAFVDAVHSGISEVSVPRYSHLTYDVVGSDPLALGADTFIVVEGVDTLGALGTRLDFAIYLHAEEEDLERWYVERFVRLCDEATTDEKSFYRQFVGMSPPEIDLLARQVWRGVNLVNLRECIAPTREFADCVVVKGTNHAVTDVEMCEHRTTNREGSRP